MSIDHHPADVQGPDGTWHKCVNPMPSFRAAFCCRCLGRGPQRDTVEEMKADAAHHMTVECGDGDQEPWEGAPPP